MALTKPKPRVHFSTDFEILFTHTNFSEISASKHLSVFFQLNSDCYREKDTVCVFLLFSIISLNDPRLLEVQQYDF